jgi:hypothetical protein
MTTLRITRTPNDGWYLSAEHAGGSVTVLDISRRALVELIESANRLLHAPHGTCPACARRDRNLKRAFCDEHRRLYRLAMGGELAGEES